MAEVRRDRLHRRYRRYGRLGAVLALLCVGTAVAVGFGITRPLPRGPSLDAVHARGVLVVGVRQYARPAPPKAPTPPQPDHFDVAMAGFLAERLGVVLRVVGLPGEPGSPAWQAAQRDLDVVIAGATRAGDGLFTVSSAYATGPGALLVLRGSRYQRVGELRGQPVCVGQGSPYATHIAADIQAVPRFYASSIRAASGFLAGECQALADDAPVIARLLTLQAWRFYRRLDADLQPADDAAPGVDSGGARIALRASDPQSTAWLDHAVRDWRRDGALARAREQRAGDIAFEASQLQDGLVCHS